MISKTKSLILILILTISIAAIGMYRYLNPGQRNIAEESALFEMNANELYIGFNSQDGKAFIDEVVSISGVITEQEPNTVILEDKIQVDFMNTPPSNVQKGNLITVKGRCIGYDDLLELVKIDQATLTN